MKNMILSIIAFFSIFTSCGTKKDNLIAETKITTNNIISNQLTSSNSSRTTTNWVGTYEGILSCTSCKTAKSVLILNKDESYDLKQICAQTNVVLDSNGIVSWSDDGKNISIVTEKNEVFNFKVEKDKLISLDKDGNKINNSKSVSILTKK